jgi:hypothetical protein
VETAQNVWHFAFPKISTLIYIHILIFFDRFTTAPKPTWVLIHAVHTSTYNLEYEVHQPIWQLPATMKIPYTQILWTTLTRVIHWNTVTPLAVFVTYHCVICSWTIFIFSQTLTCFKYKIFIETSCVYLLSSMIIKCI